MSSLWLLFSVLCVTSGRVVEDETSADEDVSKPEFQPDDIIESGFRNAVTQSYKIWQDKTVKYRIGAGFTQEEEAQLLQTMRNLESYTASGSSKCIRYREFRRGDRTYLYIRHSSTNSGCSSEVGRRTIPPKMYLDSTCFPRKTILHELMHATGFYHEHTRTDRDSYINIVLDEIPEHLEYSLEVKDDSTNQTLPYDFGSVMHYGDYYFTPKLDYYIGGRRKALGLPMSENDVIRVQRLYQCTEDLTNFRRLNPRNLTVDCSFDNDLCNLAQSTDTGVDGFDWTRGNYSTAAKGPSRGYYVYAEAENHQGQMARLTSSVLEPGQYCVSMAVYKNSFSEGNVFIIRTVDADNEQSAKRLVVKKNGSGNDNYWQLLTKFNFNVTYRWYLALDAKIGKDSQMDIAIDDVILRKC